MNAPIFLCLFLGFVISLNYVIRREHLKHLNADNNYWDKEREANMHIGGKLSNDLFTKPDTSALPYREYENTPDNKKIIKIQNTVKQKSSVPMICFKEKYTNTQLKLKYGVNNLENLTDYEDNYNSYIMALVDWGKLLIDRDNLTDAETVLNEAIRFGSDLSRNYVMLADLYRRANDTDKFDDLKAFIEASDLGLKNKILEQIMRG